MKVLLYVDGSDAAMRAVDRAIALATTGAEVLALHVYPPSLDRGMVSHFEIEPENLDATFARMVLSVVVERFAAHGLEVATLVLVGHRTEVICDHASSHGFDLILIGSPGASRLFGLELGVGDHAPIAQLRQVGDLIRDARFLLLGVSPGDPLAVVLNLGVDQLLHPLWARDAGKGVLPPLAGGLDHEVACTHQALEEALVVREVVDPLEGDFPALLAEHSGAHDEPVTCEDKMRRAPFGKLHEECHEPDHGEDGHAQQRVGLRYVLQRHGDHHGCRHDCQGQGRQWSEEPPVRMQVEGDLLARVEKLPRVRHGGSGLSLREAGDRLEEAGVED